MKSGLGPRLVRVALVTVALGGAVFLAGPRNEFGPNTPTQRILLPDNIEGLEAALAASEAAYPDIRLGTAKGIVWASNAKRRTPWSVVYIHGFSASRLETAPLAELVAKALGANVFYTRLTGHGRSDTAMGEASVQDWMADALEALRIGKTLGERVLVISCSSGSTLATWLALTPEGKQVAGHVFISPNFGPKNKRSEIINAPWGKEIAIALEGQTRGRVTDDAGETRGWNHRYPTRALFPMMAMVKNARDSDLSRFTTPVKVLYSLNDQTVDPLETQAAFARIGAPLKSIEVVNYSKSKGQHVLAGDLRSPEATAPMAASIVTWIKTLPSSTESKR